MSFIKLLTLICGLMGVVTVHAQVTITLYDSDGKPISDANIESDRKIIGKTDQNGTVVLDATYINKQICFTHINFQMLCDKATASVSQFTLKSSDNMLDAAVVMPYERITRREVVGNVSSIDMSKIPIINTSNSISALQGLAPGLDINPVGGGLGQASAVRIQGDQSLLNSAAPIYVIDGIIISEFQNNQLSQESIINTNIIYPVNGQNYRNNYLDYINFDNVESITVLKDADAVAIYGSRGANGAIVIKTKSAKQNGINIKSNYNLSWQPRRIDLMDTKEYLQMRRKAIENSNSFVYGPNYFDILLYDSLENNDWQNILMSHSTSNYNLGFQISSVSEGVKNMFSGNFSSNNHFFQSKDNKYNTYNLSNNLNISLLNNRLNFNNVSNFTIINSVQNPLDFVNFSLTAPPNFPKEIYESDKVIYKYKDELLFYEANYHPFYGRDILFKYNDFNFSNTLSLDYKLSNEISLSAKYGISYLKSFDFVSNYINKEARENYTYNNISSIDLGNRDSWNHNFDTYLTFGKSFSKFKITNIIGFNFISNNNEVIRTNYGGEPEEELKENLNLYLGSLVRHDKVFYKYAAFYNRFLLKYNNLLLNASYRTDGSSRFAKENQWASFYSFGIAWIMSDESWMGNTNLFIKPRITFGKIGNDNIPDYGYLQKFYFHRNMNYPTGNIIREENLYSKHYKWEDFHKFNIGIDFSYKKFSLILDYSISNSKDQLINFPLPAYIGQQSIFRNFPGVFRINSFELNLKQGISLSQQHELSISLLLTIPSDKLVSFPNIENSIYKNLLVVGKTKQISRIEEFIGVNSSNGLYTYLDDQGKETNNIFEANYKFIEIPQKFYGSFLIEYRIRQFSMFANIGFRYAYSLWHGRSKYSSNDLFPGNMQNNYSFLLYENYDVNKDSEYQKFLTDYGLVPKGVSQKDLEFYYLKLNSLSFNYNINKLLFFKNASISLYVNNLILSTNVRTINVESVSNTILPSLLNTGVSLKLNL